MDNNEVLKQILEEIKDFKVEVNAKFENLERDVVEIKGEQVMTNRRLTNIERDVAEIKEHSEVTRVAANRLIEWADNVEHATRFPLSALTM